MDTTHHMYGAGLGEMFFPGFGIIIQLVILLLIFAIIYWVTNTGKFNSEKPETILKRRLAKGEISKKEYLELKKEILKK